MVTKKQMVNAILREVNNAAISEGKRPDLADAFFSLAFMSESGLREICRLLGIKEQQEA